MGKEKCGFSTEAEPEKEIIERKTIESKRKDGSVVIEKLVSGADSRQDEEHIHGQTEEIIFKSKDGKAINLSDLRPKEIPLVRRELLDKHYDYLPIREIYCRPFSPDESYGKFGFWPDAGEEKVLYGNLSKKDGLLSLLHEFGHSKDYVERKKENKENPAKVNQYENWYRVWLLEHLGEAERDAWAYAIKILRKLRRQGIDLEPELKSSKDILNLVYTCLESHREMFEKIMESYDADPENVKEHVKKFKLKPEFIVEGLLEEYH